MNTKKINSLLNTWNLIIDIGEKVSIKKASKNKDGLASRIKRKKGKPIIFDCDTYAVQLKIQAALCTELPQFTGIINSQPEIMDGYSWTYCDFVELYYSHFHVVIEKLRRISNTKADVRYVL